MLQILDMWFFCAMFQQHVLQFSSFPLTPLCPMDGNKQRPRWVKFITSTTRQGQPVGWTRACKVSFLIVTG